MERQIDDRDTDTWIYREKDGQMNYDVITNKWKGKQTSKYTDGFTNMWTNK
jgi:hypothetical protein